MQFFRKYTPYLYLIVFGAIGGLGFSPTYFVPLTLASYAGFYWILNSHIMPCGTVKAAFSGWLYATLYFISNLWWTGNALLVEDNPFIWALPLAVVGFPALLAGFISVISVAYNFCLKIFQIQSERTKYTLGNALLFSGLLTSTEWMRGHMFTGFPWNLPGYVWSWNLDILQILAVFGPYTLSLLTVLIAPLFVNLLYFPKEKINIFAACMVVLAFVACGLWGNFRLANNPTVYTSDMVRVIQPNITQADKWDPVQYDSHLALFDSMISEEFGPDFRSARSALFVTPETALNEVMLSSSQAPYKLQSIFETLQTLPFPAYIYTGYMRSEPNPEDPNKPLYYNSSMLLNKNGENLGFFDKFHLVPFGEYMPYEDIIPIGPVVKFNGFQHGEGLQTLQADGLPSFSPLICYEILFPGEVYLKEDRPAVIVNITNDAWYGVSPGPFQHALMANYRAIETGLPVIRSANTGMSVVTDAHGRTLAKTALNERINLDIFIPLATDEATPYSKWRNLPFYVMLSVGMVSGLLLLLKSKN